MATLASGSLELEIKFFSRESEWVGYEIRFLWGGKPLINDALLKRHCEFWAARPEGTFLANDYKEDSLITTIEQALEQNETSVWEPMEPDALLNIRPTPPPIEPLWQSDELKREAEARKKLKSELGKLPDDGFDVMMMIDTYNFEDCHAYSGDGPALHMRVERQDLERFLFDLKLEHEVYLQSRIPVEDEDEA